MRRLLTFVCLVLLIAGPAAAETIVGLGQSELFIFDSDNPADAQGPITITGLQPVEFIGAIAFRPGTHRLYGLGIQHNGPVDNVRLYVINFTTGVATAIDGPIAGSIDNAPFYGMA